MNILTHVGDAIATANRLDAESDGTLAFFASAGRARAVSGWGPRQRRRDRSSRKTR